MKDNLNIESLFKEKFSSFEGDVSPDAWTNIQQGMSAGKVAASAVGAKVGMSLLTKVAIFSGGIIAATCGAIYLLPDNEPIDNTVNEIVVVDNMQQNELSNEVSSNETYENIIHVLDKNDPVIEESKIEIEKEIQKDRVELSENNTTDLEDQVLFNEIKNGEDTQNSEISDEYIEEQIASILGDKLKEETQTNSDNNEFVEDRNVNELDKMPSGTLAMQIGDSYAPSTYNFKSNAENYSRVIWDFGDGTIEEGETVIHTYEKAGDYVVKMSIYGLSVQVDQNPVYEEKEEVRIESRASLGTIPNIITPNGDRKNDYFKIQTTEIETFYIAISDKNGTTVFESTSTNFEWNGTDLGGNALEKDRYTYMIIATSVDGKEFKVPGQVYIK